MRREHVLPGPERGARGRAEEPGPAPDEPDEKEDRPDVEDEEREVGRRDPVDEGEQRDRRHPDERQQRRGLPPQEGRQARGHGVRQYAFRCRSPWRSVIQRILMSSESDQFSM